jgi:hypothetical protein
LDKINNGLHADDVLLFVLTLQETLNQQDMVRETKVGTRRFVGRAAVVSRANKEAPWCVERFSFLLDLQSAGRQS